jgi:siroheme synthase-like protein
MLDTDLYVACIDLRGRRALVVGGGEMAAEKAEALHASDAAVTIVADDLNVRARALVDSGGARWEQRPYEAGDLDGCLLVIAAHEDRAVNERVYADAEARSMLVNVVDVPELCNFISPALTRRPPITIAVTTSGASPALAQRIRAEIDERIDDAYAQLARLLDAERDWAKKNLPDYGARKRFFGSIVGGSPDPIELLRAGRSADVTRAIDAAKSEALR